MSSYDDMNSLTSEVKLARATKVHEMTGASFEEAREALEANNYDVLDAIVWLERKGKVAENSASYSTATGGAAEAADALEMSKAQGDYEKATRHLNFEKAFARVGAWIKSVFKKSVEISFVVSRNGSKKFSLPLLLLILLFIVAFPIMVALIIIGLFFNFSYSFDGLGTVTIDVNEWSRKASEGAEHLKQDVMDATESEKEDDKRA